VVTERAEYSINCTSSEVFTANLHLNERNTSAAFPFEESIPAATGKQAYPAFYPADTKWYTCC
jgi:hypothetical protein